MTRTRRPHVRYSTAEMRWLESNRAMVISDYQRAFCAEFGRDDVTAADLHGLRKRKDWKTGRSGHFTRGAVPANKGKRQPYHPNSAATQFNKGRCAGVANRGYKPIGTERIQSGYRALKIHDGLPRQSRWKFVHHIEWEKVNGPVPDGMVLKCKGDRLSVEPANWQLVPRALLPRLNGRFGRGYDSAPADLKPTIMAVAKLEHQVRAKRT